jgi:hypothetical protein
LKIFLKEKMDNYSMKKILAICSLLSFFALSGQAQAQAVPENASKLNPTVIDGLRIGVNLQVTNNTKPTLTGGLNHPNASVYVIVNKQTFRGTNNGDGTWAAGVTEDLPDGIYDIIVIATPPAGNRTVMKTDKGLMIDTVAPNATIESVTTADPSPALSGTTDDTTAILVVKINDAVYTAKNNGDGTWMLPAKTISPELKPGAYEISILVGDLAGNLGTTAQGTLVISGKEGFPASDPAHSSDSETAPPLDTDAATPSDC